MAEQHTPRTFGDLEPSTFPGERLGLPRRGSGSVARAGRRIAAYLIDLIIAVLAAFVLFGSIRTPEARFFPLMIFVVLQIVFIPTIGGSLGHRLLGMRVASLDGTWVGAWRPVVRTALLVLLIPALVWDSDQRGFHDKVAGTVLLRA